MTDKVVLQCETLSTDQLNDGKFDCLVVVSQSIEAISNPTLKAIVTDYQLLDSSLTKSPSTVLIPVAKDKISCGRVIFGSTGPINRDFDDVRRFYEAGKSAVEKAIKIGSKSPLLVLPSCDRFPLSATVTLLGAFHSLYTPLEVRDSNPEKSRKVDKLGIFDPTKQLVDTVELANSIEAGRIVLRDILTSDPVRMAPVKCADYIQSTFAGQTEVKVELISDQSQIDREFPCYAAVNRAVKGHPQFEARLVKLTYEPSEGPIEKTLMFAGKGVTFDSGGMNVKVGTFMEGMHRDKGGAATVAGFFKVLSIWKPKGLKVVGFLPFVRNGISVDAYTCDEIITAHSGRKIRVFNTDAEGRMILVDCLSHMRELAVKEKLVNPHLISIATLTGHACKTVGNGYSIIVDNGPAKGDLSAEKLQKSGDSLADPIEISTLRREDYDNAKEGSEYADIRQTSKISGAIRGHQFAMAFLALGSKLDEHGSDAELPLKYSHIDMAAVTDPYPGVPVGQPLSALIGNFILPRLNDKKFA